LITSLLLAAEAARLLQTPMVLVAAVLAEH
jgi:hypothetical protein